MRAFESLQGRFDYFGDKQWKSEFWKSDGMVGVGKVLSPRRTRGTEREREFHERTKGTNLFSIPSVLIRAICGIRLIRDFLSSGLLVVSQGPTA